jgi:hypothetical protein
MDQINENAFDHTLLLRTSSISTIFKILILIMNEASLLTGNKLYQERARLTLPFLVKQSQIGKTILYSDLAHLIDIKNPRSFNYILGYIGEAIQKLEEIHKIEIPKIQCIVIDKKDGLPGAGVGWYLPKKEEFHKLNKEQKRNFLDRQLFEIYTYRNWNWVLERFGLKPIDVLITQEIKEIKNGGFGGGESVEHKIFKEFIATNPKTIGINNAIVRTTVEYKLASADEVDVLFNLGDKLVGVEVKTILSNDIDILRGIFQCVKYKAVLRAEQLVSENIDIDCILVIQTKLTEKQRNVAFILKVDVVEYLTE